VFVWFIEFFAYILLAHIEEIDLSRKFGEDFATYKKQVPFFIPFLKTQRKELDLLISTAIPTILLFIMFQLH